MRQRFFDSADTAFFNDRSSLAGAEAMLASTEPKEVNHALEFLERAEETGARILIVFASLIETAESVSRVREMFTAGGRGDVVLFVAGGPFSADQALARSVGANGVARGAESALKLVTKVAAQGGGS